MPAYSLADYLREMQTIRASGAGQDETSYYGPIGSLLNGAGETLQPAVHFIPQLRNRGAGIPDGGLFTPDQLRTRDDAMPLLGQTPSRGVVEIKPPTDDIVAVAETEQVERYLRRYGQVLVCSFRDFLVVTQDQDGGVELGERFTLAPDAERFWSMAGHAWQAEADHGERLTEYLKRALLRPAPLAAPRDLAFFLASYARDARNRLEHEGLPSLATLRAAFEETLGIHFQGERGDHFFKSTLVQTLFYGLFSAWVLWSKQQGIGSQRERRFNWREAVWLLQVPAVSGLFEEIAQPSNLREFNLVEVLDWTGDALNRVERASFFARFAEDHAVQYFYEPFLEAFDPDLRRELGVWYTPAEVVDYMVERVDRVLRDELGIADGLADPQVYVLDPCTGTGSYLVATLKRIERTLREKGEDALVAHEVKRAVTERVAGFEILPAPFVIAHLQVGLLLQELSTPLHHRDGHSGATREHAGVYLTNALTGWNPEAETEIQVPFPALAASRTSSRSSSSSATRRTTASRASRLRKSGR